MSRTTSRRARIERCVISTVIVPMALAVVAATNPAVCSAAPSFAAVAPTRAPARAPVEAFNYDRFGEVHLYRGRGHIRDVVLFVSGEGGWDSGTASLAQRLADRGVLVAGIDFPHYRQQLEKDAQECVSPAPDFENLSHYLQSTLGLKKYLQPILVGYASGATLVYATLAEAPEGLFKSALSIGFTPELPLKRALCESPNLHATPRWDAKGVLQGMTLSPARELPAKWISLQSSQEPASSAPALRNFAAGWPGSEVVSLGPVGRDYPIEERWMPQFDAAFGRLAASRSEAKVAALPAPVADLPLIIVPAAAGGLGNWFAVFLTGDGGWVGLDKGVSAELAKHGMPIVGWDSLKYFWSRRTPDGASRDLDRVLHYYSGAWGRSHALLIGYSQGADTMPFMVNRLPAATRELVAFTTLMGISDNALFEFHVATWLGSPAKGIPTAPELAHWQGSPYLCLYGESDGDSACAELTGHGGSALKMSGGHHFGGGYTQVADAILSRLPATP